jgi:4-amino-4-deoxy-L-arabinose transferase-like glycosyltransferase
MRLLKNEDLKIFLTFLIIYSLFIHWVGWNEETRLLTAISIIEKNTFDINSYANFTGDRILVDGKYYSDKSPGISLFLSPIYFIFKASLKEYFGSNKYVLVPQPQFNTTVYFIKDNLEKSVLMTMIFGVIFLSSLVGALSVVLFRRILLFYFSKNTSLIISIIFGLSSLVFPYSTVLMGTSFSLFLLLLSFYILQKDYKQKYVIGGTLLGLSFLVDYTSIFVILPLIFFIWNKTSTSEKIKLFLSFLLGLSPLFIYSFSIFNNPLGFLTYYNFVDPNIFPCTYGKIYFEFCPELSFISFESLPIIILVQILKTLHLLIFTYRGIFFYNPLLLFSIIGLFFAFKRNKQLFSLSLSTFLFSVFSISFYSYWFGGSSFGPRYLVNSLPFTILPLGYLLEDKRFKRSKILIGLFSLSILISTFHMFLSTAANWEGVIVIFDKTGAYLYANWYDKSFFATNFRELNPLYQHYLPALLDNGPRSRILEFLLALETPDIRDFRQIPYREIKILSTPLGFLVFRINFLSFILVVLAFVIIWSKELNQHKFIGISLKQLIIIILVLLFLSRIEVEYIAFGKGWMPQGINETVKWSSKNGEIYIFSPIERDVILNISVLNYRGKTLELYINDNLINNYTSPENILEIVRLKKGENKLLLLSKEDCEIPLYVENQLRCSSVVECMKFNTTIFKLSFDARCLSFGIVNVSIVPIDILNYFNNNIIFGSNWYSEEKYKNQTFRYFSQNATIIVPFSGTFKINLTIHPYHSTKTLEIYVNDKLLGSYKIDVYKNLLTPTVLLEKPLNIIKLKSKEGCEIPAYLENSSDYRCLSFSLWNISFINFEELARKNLTILYGFGFYEQEKEGRWMSDNGVIYLINNSKLSKVFITLESFKRNRTLYVLLQNRSYFFEIPANKINTISFAAFPENETEIKLISFPTCEIASEKDKRCLSIFIRELQVKDVEYIDFYPQEIWNNITFRWFSFSSKVNILLNTSNVYVLNFNAWAPSKQKRILKIFLNGEFVNSYKINESMQEIKLPLFLKAGENELVFVSDNCSYVFNDPRCLGIAISEIQKEYINIQNIEKIANGFYGLEKAYGSYFRWLGNEGEISLFSSQNASVKLYVKIGWTYFSDRNLNITFNDKQIFAEKIAKNGKEFSTKVSLVEGWNKIRFTSTCDIPAILEFGEDKRCLSLAFMSLSFLPSSS